MRGSWCHQGGLGRWRNRGDFSTPSAVYRFGGSVLYSLARSRRCLKLAPAFSSNHLMPSCELLALRSSADILSSMRKKLVRMFLASSFVPSARSRLESTCRPNACRVLVAQLQRGTCDVLVSGKRLAGSTAIASLRAIILARPTIDRRLHQHVLSHLDRSMAGLTIIDMVGNCERHGLWTGAVPEITVGDMTEVITDPALDHLSGMTHKQALAWAGSKICRIVLLQKAKGRKARGPAR
jgi:hypothetical protein